MMPKNLFKKISGRTILAPIAGINDLAFRMLCRDCDASLVYTEMVSANALSRNNKATIMMLDSIPEEKPVIVQMFGQNTESLVEAAKILSENYNFDAIDINFGCPAMKIIGEGAGSALLNRPAKIGEIVKKVSGAVNIPVTAKIRAGINFKNIIAVKVAKIIEENGASAIAVHGRVAIQGYAGKANWNYIKDVKEAVEIPVIGNGDIVSPETAKGMIDETGCDYVMIGRAARGNPLLFKQCEEFIKYGTYERYNIPERVRQFYKYLEYAQKFNINFKFVKVQANYFTKGVKGGALIRDKLARVQTIDEVKGLFEKMNG
jgi:tRNA-dihydrouridine synthase B